MRMAARITALMTLLWLAACGQKGPLYLPTETAPAQQPAPSVVEPSADQSPDVNN